MWAGVGTCLKNYIQFVPDRPSYHPDGCAALGRIWTLPIVKGETPIQIAKPEMRRLADQFDVADVDAEVTDDARPLADQAS